MRAGREGKERLHGGRPKGDETGMRYPASQSKTLLDMEVANYCEGLDPSYSTLGFENAEVIYGGGKTCSCRVKCL